MVIFHGYVNVYQRVYPRINKQKNVENQWSFPGEMIHKIWLVFRTGILGHRRVIQLTW